MEGKMQSSGFRVGVVRVATLESKEHRDLQGRLIERNYPQIQTTSRCIPEQPLGIYDDKSEEEGIPKVIALAKEFEQEGFDAVVVSCAADPGVDILKKELSIAVFGAGESAATMAGMYGTRIAVIGITETIPIIYKKVLGDKLMAYERPATIKASRDILKPEGKESTLRAAQELKDRGADVIAFACTGYSTAGMGSVIEKELRIPVIDAVLALGAFVSFEHKRQCNISSIRGGV